MKKRIGLVAFGVITAAFLLYVIFANDPSEDKPVTTSPEVSEDQLSVGVASQGGADDPSADAGETPIKDAEAVSSAAKAEENSSDDDREGSATGRATEDVQRYEELAGSQRFTVPDPDEEREARIAVSRQIFGDAGPRACDNVCDCNPGEGCDTSAGICIPGLPAGRCCGWEQCPVGAPCTTADGKSSTCE